MEKVALLTGAAGGLGQALAAKLVRDGWTLVLVGRDGERLRAAYGNSHCQIIADCSTVAGARDMLEQARVAGLQPTALAHCVGNIRLGALHRVSEEDFQAVLTANLVSAFHTLAAFTASLRESAVPGAAVLVSSAAARVGTPNHEAVAAAKGGVEALVRSAAATYANFGIRVNAVAPGIMDTPAAARLIGSPAAREAAARQYPLPGIGTSAELAELMAWLLGTTGSRVTGQVWSLDGGFSSIRPLVK